MKSKKLVNWLIKILIDATCILDIRGLDNIPQEGGYIIASNHLGRIDVLLAYRILNRPDIILTIAEKYERFYIFRWAARALNAIFINRFVVDFKALRIVLKRLKCGEVLIIAPEGTRSKNEALIEGKPGTAYLAEKTSSLLIPVALTGTEDRLINNNLRKLKRSRVTISVGQPFKITVNSGLNRNQQLKQATDEIMCRIAALLPVKYRGFYSEHHRLQSLLVENSKYMSEEQAAMS